MENTFPVGIRIRNPLSRIRSKLSVATTVISFLEYINAEFRTLLFSIKLSKKVLSSETFIVGLITLQTGQHYING